MDLQGRVIAVMPEKSGVSKSGNEWKVQEYVIETHDAYPKKMVFSVFGADRIAQFAIQIGEEITVSFDIDAHEYQGRWYNSIRAFAVTKNDKEVVNAGGPVVTAKPEIDQQPSTETPAGDNKIDDLPF